MDMNEIDERVRKEGIEKLTAIGLPELIAQHRDNPWNLEINHIACGTDGKAIVCRNRWAKHIAEVLSNMLNSNLKANPFESQGKLCHYFTAGKLTIPERHTLQIMTRYFDSYYPGFQADSEYVTFPSAMRAYGAPAEYEEETDAFEAAEVLTEVSQLDSDVIETTNGYAVVLYDECGNLADSCVAEVVGATRVLESFSCARKQKRCFDTVMDDDGYSENWQKRIGEQYTQQRRIEETLNAVLSRLGHPAAQDIADSITTGAELVENIEAIARPGGRSGGVGKIAGKKSSTKRSA